MIVQGGYFLNDQSSLRIFSDMRSKKAFFAKIGLGSSSQKPRIYLFLPSQLFDGNEKPINPDFDWLLEG